VLTGMLDSGGGRAVVEAAGMSDSAGVVDERYSEPGAEPSTWQEVVDVLEGAQTYWLSTVRDDGRPHVTPLIAVWHEEALYVSTGEREQKFRNLAANPRVAVTTGGNKLTEGVDVIVEGAAVRVGEAARLERLAARWLEKYGAAWRYEVRDGNFWHEGGGAAAVFEVAPTTVFAFRKGGRFTQTRWRLG
jgi:nitroimidazol reductase NimA-like FMN-containing flavoprotein (pyridoxamine 5'-phosphate oxidase superfamily)